MKTNELKINKRIIDALHDMNITTLMSIQEKAIPYILDGKNFIGEAETGTGKTAAFLVPILDKVNLSNNDLECLIVTPTRELAMQITNQIDSIGKYLDIKHATLVGGMSIRDQSKLLRDNPKIVIGTLGRINDHIRGNRLKLDNIKYFVLDEADEMLKEGFKEDISAINKCLPKNKQVLLFSATFSKQVLMLSKDIMDEYEFISVKDKDSQSINIEQYYLIIKEKNKLSLLIKLLDIDKPTTAIVFGRTKRRADELNEALVKLGYKSSCIHGDLSQNQRNEVMKRFRENKTNILVATDVAARGLDISGISHVYNFDLPQEVEFYIHRIGRTGRANEHGVSYSFIREMELPHIKRIQVETKTVIKEMQIPSYKELLDAKNEEVYSSIDSMLSKIDITTTKEFSKELIDQYGSEKLVSVLIETLFKNRNVNEIELTGEPPVKVRGKVSYNRDNRNKSRNNKNQNYIKDRFIHKRRDRRKTNYKKS